MRKLWIDDIRNPPDDTFDIARSYGKAIAMLDAVNYDEVYLDHDLADFTDVRERTGYDVVMWLASRAHDGGYVPNKYFMLTANPVGRRNMSAVIERYLSIPLTFDPPDLTIDESTDGEHHAQFRSQNWITGAANPLAESSRITVCCTA